ncbi:MAG: crAss001_48 related protein [Oscillospiraceae bacterium]
MQDLIKRIEVEKNELDIKIEKLGYFLGKENDLEPNQMDLLDQQFKTMKEYSNILSQRLQLLK